MNVPKCLDTMHVFHNLARDMFWVERVYSEDVGRKQIHKM